METKECSACQQVFNITADDMRYYEKFAVPAPSLCVNCRAQRRMLHFNQTHLFKSTCAATGESIITHFPSDVAFPVFSQKHWYGDTFDAAVFGREVDFSRSFFEQYKELSDAVARPALFTDYLRDENCAYTNFAGRNKNCYLIFDSDENWDCYYTCSSNSCKSSCDCYRVENLELCYEALDSRGCYSCAYIINCENCRDSALLANCIGCKNCLMCSNLQHKEYCVLNDEVSKDEFQKLRSRMGSFKVLREMQAKFEEFRQRFPQKYLRGFQNEDAVGNYLVNCKNAFHCFDCRELRDGRYCFQTFMRTLDCMDVEQVGEAELCYECMNSGYNAYFLRFSQQCLNQVSYLTYCDTCINGCANLIGCIGLKRKKFCILNKEYCEDEYRELEARLIAHMQETGEWGEHWPAWISPFPYNITQAALHFPLSKTEAVSQGFTWKEYDSVQASGSQNIPDSINDVSDSITKQTLVCETSGKGYKVLPQELALYRQFSVPIPRECFEVRNRRRARTRAERVLHARPCSSCGTLLMTAYGAESAAQVHCEECYVNSLG